MVRFNLQFRVNSKVISDLDEILYRNWLSLCAMYSIALHVLCAYKCVLVRHKTYVLQNLKKNISERGILGLVILKNTFSLTQQSNYITVEPVYIEHSREMKKCSMYAGVQCIQVLSNWRSGEIDT